MREKDYRKLLRKLDQVQESVNKSLEILKEKTTNPKYPDMHSLEAMTKSHSIDCNAQTKYTCYNCEIKKRNNCWKNILHKQRRNTLKSGIPYTREMLGEMKISDLWIIASHLNTNPRIRTKSAMVQAIIKKQNIIKEKNVNKINRRAN